MSDGITVEINYAQLAKDMEEFIGNDITSQTFVDTMIKGIFQREKSAMLREFKDHPITRELEAGPEPNENPSATLNGQQGNLFSFLGFYFTREPTKSLEMLLEKDTTIIKSTRRGCTFYYRVYYPDKSDIENVTHMDWGNGTSWAYGVEDGDFGGDAALSHYIYKEYLGGRSLQGVQVQGNYSANNFSPKPYITEIMGHFIEKMNNNIV